MWKMVKEGKIRVIFLLINLNVFRGLRVGVIDEQDTGKLSEPSHSILLPLSESLNAKERSTIKEDSNDIVEIFLRVEEPSSLDIISGPGILVGAWNPTNIPRFPPTLEGNYVQTVGPDTRSRRHLSTHFLCGGNQ